MKIFQDKGKTILPRIDSILLASRLLTILAAIWVLLFNELSQAQFTGLALFSLAYLLLLVIFWRLIKSRKYDLKKPYLLIILFELFFVSDLIILTGGINSDLFLLYYLTIGFAAYVMTLTATTVLFVIIVMTYVLMTYTGGGISIIINLAMRIGLMCFLSLAISFVSDYIRRSERRFLRLFDTLNQRTSELEKSQSNLEMIYENSRILGGILDIDEVVDGVMKIMSDILVYPASGLLLAGPGGNYIYRGRSLGAHTNYHLKAVNRDKDGLISGVAAQAEPVAIEDISIRDDYEPLRPNAKSLMLVPMIAHGKTTGVLSAESPQVGAFKERDLKILSVVARSAAMALENATLHRKMEELTVTDDLTGIYNYRYFAVKLKEEQRRADRYNLPLSLIMLDIDWFKSFNDKYGHEVGNMVLKGIATVVKKCIRDVDIFCRYGGEEFIIILPQTPRDEVARIGERIRQQIETTSFGGEGGLPALKVTVSAGVSSFPENGKPNDELLSVTDQALYRAKGAGKNMVCVI
jgi:diguanylate cyclase (GGDEF)-like protein